MKNKKIFGVRYKKLRSWFLYWAVVGVGMFVLLFFITTTWIGVSVKDNCQIAVSKYGSDCVGALMATLEDENNSFRQRNNAIWALGQLGDPRALPLVRSLYTGNILEREPYNDGLSQYEMKKAIKLLEGGVNVTHMVWKHSECY